MSPVSPSQILVAAAGVAYSAPVSESNAAEVVKRDCPGGDWITCAEQQRGLCVPRCHFLGVIEKDICFHECYANAQTDCLGWCP